MMLSDVCRVHHEYSLRPHLLEARRAGRRTGKACIGWSWAAACGVQGRGHIVRPCAQLVKFCIKRFCRPSGVGGCSILVCNSAIICEHLQWYDCRPICCSCLYRNYSCPESGRTAAVFAFRSLLLIYRDIVRLYDVVAMWQLSSVQ